MTMTNQRLAAILIQQKGSIVERWMAALRRRSWALSGAKALADGGPAPLEVLHERGQAFLDGLIDGLSGTDALEVGAPAFREPIQLLSFTAGWLAGGGLPAGDALAVVHALEEALEIPGMRSFFESLQLVVVEAFAAAASQREQARYRDAMEKTQLVCTPHPRLPCLFLVGDPDLQALDDALGRLLMLAVMREAPAFIVDGSGLFNPGPVIAPVVERLAEERRVTARAILSGLAPEHVARLREGRGAGLGLHEGLPEAFAEAAALLGITWPTTY